jgi:hypothetical protein
MLLTRTRRAPQGMAADEFQRVYHFPKPTPQDAVVLHCRTNRRAAWAAQLCRDVGLHRVLVYRQVSVLVLVCASWAMVLGKGKGWNMQYNYVRRQDVVWLEGDMAIMLHTNSLCHEMGLAVSCCVRMWVGVMERCQCGGV